VKKNHFFNILICLLLCSCVTGQKSEQRAALFLQIGNDYIEQRDYPDALTNLLEADKLAPNNPEILNSIGMLYFHRDKYDVAIGYLERAIKLSPKYTDARNNYARVLISLAQYNSAIKQLGLVLKDMTYSQLDKAYTNLGLAYFRKDQFSKAKPLFLKALTSNQNYCPAYNLYGQTLLKLNEYQTATSIFDQALRMCETDLEELNYFSAITDYQLGRKSQAKAHLQEIIRSSPASEYAEKAQKLLAALEQGQQ
jgi:type IV pilus assembly protein PilF